mmetsp:Transcript_45682/g.97345  ORF Transcript_45682/g.97345 Transcript_45682/m.97345 type:complete len:283 (+) Transcript_45682:1881-2729(+)
MPSEGSTSSHALQSSPSVSIIESRVDTIRAAKPPTLRHIFGCVSARVTSTSMAAMRCVASSCAERASDAMPSSTCGSTGRKRRGWFSATSDKLSSAVVTSVPPVCSAPSSAPSASGSASPSDWPIARYALREVLAVLRAFSSAGDRSCFSASCSAAALVRSSAASDESAACLTSGECVGPSPSTSMACTLCPHAAHEVGSTSAGAMWLSTESADSCTSGVVPSAHAPAMKAESSGHAPSVWNSAPSLPMREQSLRLSEGARLARVRLASRPALTCSRASAEK